MARKISLARRAAMVGRAAKQGRCKAALVHYTGLAMSAAEAGKRSSPLVLRARGRLNKYCVLDRG